MSERALKSTPGLLRMVSAPIGPQGKASRFKLFPDFTGGAELLLGNRESDTHGCTAGGRCIQSDTSTLQAHKCQSGLPRVEAPIS